MIWKPNLVHHCCCQATKLSTKNRPWARSRLLNEITDNNGTMHTTYCSDLRHRKRHSVVFGNVTDNNIHDRYAMYMHHITNHELNEMEKYMLGHKYPADIPAEKILHFHQYSDNVGQHFKIRVLLTIIQFLSIFSRRVLFFHIAW